MGKLFPFGKLVSYRVRDRGRTRDRLDVSEMLYQLSYTHKTYSLIGRIFFHKKFYG